MELSLKDILNFESRKRAALVNSISGYKSANLVGTVSDSGVTNLSIVSSCVHIGSTPPFLAIVFRPNTVPRDTLENIKETGVYTINHIHEEIIENAHQTAARYDSSISEFDECHLTAECRDDFVAPFVKESKIKMGMELREHYLVKSNETEIIIGEVQMLILPDEVMKDDGSLSLDRASTVCLSGLDKYSKPEHLKTLSYAKPGQWPELIS